MAGDDDGDDRPGAPRDSGSDSGSGSGSGDVDDTPTVSCERCGREWDLEHELDDLGAGNRAVEQFALDHRRHTGHFPDGVATWRADCRHCPEEAEHLAERPARRWAETHARHTRHTVAVHHARDGGPTLVGDDRDT